MKRSLIIGLVLFVVFVLIIAGVAIILLGQSEEETFTLKVGDYVTHQWFKNDTPSGSPRTWEVLEINGTFLYLKLTDFEGIWHGNYSKNQTIFSYDESIMNDELGPFTYTPAGKEIITTHLGKSITTDHYVNLNSYRIDVWVWNGILIRVQEQYATGTQTLDMIDTNIPQLNE